MKKLLSVFIFTVLGIALFSFQNCSNKLVSEDTPVIDYSSVQSVHPDCQFKRMGLMEDDGVRAYRTSTVPIGQSCQSEIRTCRSGGLTGSFEYSFCLPGAPAACLLNGNTVAHGASIKVFQSASVANGATGNDTCEAKSEWRTCNNGTLSGSFTALTCVNAQPDDCMFNNQVIRHNGRTDKLYKDAAVGYDQVCLFEIRYCKNGVLSGTYTNTSCRPADGANCPVNGFTVLHNDTQKFYTVASVAYNATCPAQFDRRCTNGSLSGEATAIHRTCAPVSARNCSLDGVTVNHLDIRKFYKVRTVANGESCEVSSLHQMRKCTDSDLDGDDVFQYKECEQSAAAPPPPPPVLGASCTTADGVVVTDTSTLEVRKTLLIRDGNCNDSGNKETLYCKAGEFRLANINGAVVSEPRYANCTDTEMTHHEGGTGGEFNRTCPNGAKIMGFTFSANHQNEDIDGLRLICSSGDSAFIGSVEGSHAESKQCPAGTSLVGLRGRYYGGMFNAAAPICASDNGANRTELSAYGWDRSYYPEFYTVCKPGYVVNRVKGTWSGSSIMGMSFECVRTATASQVVNVNCAGRWIEQGCDGTYNISMFYIFQFKGGNGAECSTANRASRTGSFCGQYEGGGGPN